jgi:hypothetical protein
VDTKELEALTGVMVADNGPLYAYVDVPLKI